MKHQITQFLLLALALLAYGYFCYQFDFTQDDAYISYRYAQNFLNGDGLVYNIGERVEGYTNIGWVIYMIFWGALGAGYIFVSKLSGFLLGGGVIVLTWLIGRVIWRHADEPYVWLAVYLVAINQSLAYWSPAGLETAAFAFTALMSLYLYLSNSRLLPLSLVWAVLLRPEGALVAFILIAIETVEKRDWPFYTLRSSAVALAFCLPMLAFKIGYYGGILPNPFYAKTGVSFDKLLDGLEYAGRFFSHYGFYGLGLLIPVLFWRKLPASLRAIWIFSAIYIVYIVIVGGDVLKVHRFFMPVLGPSALLIVGSIWIITRKAGNKVRYGVVAVAGVALLWGTYVRPVDFVNMYNRREKSFTAKMSFVAKQLKASDPGDFSVALPTIGIFGYELIGHRIIDMVGLTDSTIARHSEDPIPGMASTWKERNHNSRYLLAQAPDYISFSTGIKPSAPAEKALFLYRQFQDCYRTIGWDDNSDPDAPLPIIRLIFKRVCDIEGELTPTHPLEYVDHYKKGLESYVAGDFRGAVRWYEKALDVSPGPGYIYIHYDMAFSYLLMGEYRRALDMMNEIVERDSLIFMAHSLLYKHAVVEGDRDKALRHWRHLESQVPWLLPQLRAEAAELLRNRRK